MSFISHSPVLIALRGVGKQFSRGGSGPLVPALRDVDLSVWPGEFVAVLGKSGSGKSTLLNLVAGLDRASDGEIEVAGATLHGMGEDARARWRGRSVGVVFQFFQLLPTLTVRENVLLAMDLLGAVPRGERRGRAEGLLARVGLTAHAGKLPGALSGGEQQRVAIARALANDPPLLLADEPTGNLDSHSAEGVLDLFAELVAGGTTLLLVTHDEDMARRRAHRLVRVADGAVVEDRRLTAGGGTGR